MMHKHAIETNLHRMENMGDNDIRPRLFYQTAKPSTEDDLYAKLAPAEEDGGNTWNYNTDKETNDAVEEGKELRHLPAPNTLFINSNIALTDGKNKRISESKTIPNLYDAIDTMATKIHHLDKHITIDNGDITLNGDDIRFNCKSFNKDGKDTVITMQAIVEAIRELNRRTAYIDSTLGFEEAVDYLDVNDEEIDGVYANQYDDGLPAATNSHYSGHFIEYHPADANCSCELEEPVEHNAKITQEIGKPPTIVVTTGTDMKNTQGARPIERSFDVEDDPEIITVENQSVRMRGCPYLMI